MGHFSRMHEVQFHPATNTAYRRLKQHDYGRRLRKLRGQTRGSEEMGGTTDRSQKRTRAKVNERVGRISNEGGRSPVAETFRERERNMERRPSDRERSNPPREDPRGEVRDGRREKAILSEAGERSRGTEETRESIRGERTPVILECRDALHDGDRKCNGCVDDRFSTVMPDARCDALCQRYNECQREIDATAREEVRAEAECSRSLTGDGERGQVQVQLRRDTRATDREREERYGSQEDGRDERGGYDERDARDEREARDERLEREREERYAIDERDERALETARKEIRRAMTEPDPRDAAEEADRRKRVDHDMRGRIDDEREHDSGRRPEPRDTRIETRAEKDQRRRNDTGIKTDSVRRIQAPQKLRSSDGSGRTVGHLDEPMADIPSRYKCKGTRSMPSCSSVVTFEPTEKSPLRVTFEHGVNGPDDYVAKQKAEAKKKKVEARLKAKEARKADREALKLEEKEKRLAAKLAKKAEKKKKKKKKKGGKKKKKKKKKK